MRPVVGVLGGMNDTELTWRGRPVITWAKLRELIGAMAPEQLTKPVYVQDNGTGSHLRVLGVELESDSPSTTQYPMLRLEG